jgi:hypothetical protein
MRYSWNLYVPNGQYGNDMRISPKAKTLRRGWAGHGWAWRGEARRGWVGRGMAWFGKAWRGVVGRGMGSINNIDRSLKFIALDARSGLVRDGNFNN